MIKIYTEQSYLSKENKGKYFPLFDDLVDNSSSKLHNNYCFVNLVEECDILILPLFIDYLLGNNGKELINSLKKMAVTNKKPLWVFASGDFGLTVKEDYIYVFKMADFESKRGKKTIIMPAFIEDPYKSIYNSEMVCLKKSTIPVVGYVGHAKGGLTKYVKFFINVILYNYKVFVKKTHSDYFKPYSSSHKRLNYLKILLKVKGIKTNFIFRDKYRAGSKSKDDRTTTTLEFFDNIKASHYTFCMRGFGNFSVRLYETLAMGRIPLQVDTDCSLPLSEFLNWEEHCLIVKENEINNLGSRLIEHNKNIENSDFIVFQKRNRAFWENYLTRENFFVFVHDLFVNNQI